jgi:hypothetical protein
MRLRLEDAGYGQVPNDVATHREMSWEAMGLYAYMRCQRDGWSFTLKSLRAAKESEYGKGTGNQRKVSVEKLVRMCRELEELGLLLRQKKNAREYEYVIGARLGNPESLRLGNPDARESRPPYKKITPNQEDNSTEPFDLEATLAKWREGADRAFKVLAYYIVRRKVLVPTKDALDRLVRRHVADAKALQDYPPSKIKEVMDGLTRWEKSKGDDKLWHLGSVVKQIAK